MPPKEKKENDKPCNDNCQPKPQGKGVESLMKNIDVCRSVGLEIINRTRTVTLTDFRWVPLSLLLLSATLPMRDIPEMPLERGSVLSAKCRCNFLHVPPSHGGPSSVCTVLLHTLQEIPALSPSLSNSFLSLYLFFPFFFGGLAQIPCCYQGEFLSLPAWGSQS